MPLPDEKRAILIESVFSLKKEIPTLILAMKEWQRHFSMEQIKLTMIYLKITSFERHIKDFSKRRSSYQKKMTPIAQSELNIVVNNGELLISRYRASVEKYNKTVHLIQFFSRTSDVDFSVYFDFLASPILDILDDTEIEEHLMKIGSY
jgi:hypothetical protein